MTDAEQFEAFFQAAKSSTVTLLLDGAEICLCAWVLDELLESNEKPSSTHEVELELRLRKLKDRMFAAFKP